jgi:hypothetical protein
VRIGLLVVLAAVLAGCGSVAGQPAEDSQPADDPQIRAVDRPAPGADKSFSEVQYTLRLVPSWDPCEEPPTAENLLACEEQEELEQHYKADEDRENARYAEDTSPAGGTEPRVVAELPLADELMAELVSWQARDGKTCTLARIVPAGRAGAQRIGECTRSFPCEEICLAILAMDDHRAVLAGTVTAGADKLHLGGPDNREREYVLSGPVIEETDRRVFITDLGDEDWWTVEIRRGDEILASDESLGAHLRGFRCANESAAEFERCYASTPLPPQPQPVDEPDEEADFDCERQFDENDAGFQLCGEGEARDSE